VIRGSDARGSESGAGAVAVQLDVLGRIGLRVAGPDPAAVPADAVLVQPKRLALLVWMALRRPGGLVRRDELLGVFWPASDEARARASLRQALQFLRRNLGAHAIVNRGVGEVGIDPAHVDCDAVAFLNAIDRGDDDIALDRYGGDLLPGFILDGAHEFDRWLQSERQRLRAAAIAAALRMAERAQVDGDDSRAAERLARALRLEPTDESVARRLMAVLARSGNRAAALATYAALADRLHGEFELEPSPQTTALADRLREDRATPGDAASAAGAGAPNARVLSAQRVLVLALENRTGEDRFELLGGLAAETIAQGLAGVRELEVVPPIALGPPPHVASELARRTGAGTLITGTVHCDADGLLFQVSVTDVAAGRLLCGPEPVRAAETGAIAGIERLRERVLTAIAPALTQRAVHVREATRPPHMDAYRAYLDGLERFVRGEWSNALAHFDRAGELAPDYALPRIVSAITHWNMGELRDARDAAREAEKLSMSLGRFERAVLDMVSAWLSGDWAAAHRASIVQADMAPGSIPHFQVAEEARRLNRPREARDVLGRLDPEAGELRGWIFYWVELATAHHMLRDHARELEVASRCRQLHPHDPTAALLEIRAFAALGRVRDVVRVVDQLLASPAARPSPGALMVEAALELRAHDHGTPAADAARSLLERAVEWYRTADSATAPDGGIHSRALGRALYHAGRLDEARALFETLVATAAGAVWPIDAHHPQLQAHLDEGVLAVIAARTGDADALAQWCEQLEGLEGPFLYGAQWYWLAGVAALQGDADRAVRMLRRAFADGLPMEMFIHADPHLAGLSGDERFNALMRPRG
jgi:DNA-binding SARP family transcriptional activator